MYNKQKLNALLVFLYMAEYGTETPEHMLISDLIFAVEHSEFYKQKPIDEEESEFIAKSELEQVLRSMLQDYVDIQSQVDENLLKSLTKLI